MNLIILSLLCTSYHGHHPRVIHRMPVLEMVDDFPPIVEIFKTSVEEVNKKNNLFRDIIAPGCFVVGPQYLFLTTLDKAITLFPVQSNTVSFVVVTTVILYYILLLQIEFITRYFQWVIYRQK